MLKRSIITLILLAGIMVSSGFLTRAECQHSLGGGIHYLRTLGDIKDTPGWDANAIGYMVSYQYGKGAIRLEGDLEWIPNYGSSDKTMFQPQAWVLLGRFIYAGGGIGGSYIDGSWFDNPFYGLRLGVNLTLAGINFDGFTAYQFQSSKVFDELDQTDLDALTFGVLVRFEL